MAQEVQTTLNYQAELNEIQWIWYQERKISDKMQVRDKKSNQLTAWFTVPLSNYTPASPWSFTISVIWDVIYKTDGGKIYLPEAWAYMLQYMPDTSYTQATYYYTIAVKLDGITVYSERTTLGDHTMKSCIINAWRKNALTLVFTPEWSSWANIYPTIKLIKL